jgi:RimJ/RimL family protein N-acetyltransferase
MSAPVVRRVRLHEWAEVRALRISAVSDPAAAMAFLTSPAQELARDEAFWRQRTAGAALGEDAAQFVAVAGDTWVGTATVLLREPEGAGEAPTSERRADIVGVWIAPDHRGSGLLRRLVDAAEGWASAQGAGALTLSVHRDNARAQAAYRKVGFTPTGLSFTSAIGPEIEMRRSR